MPQSKHESSINWNRYAKTAIRIATRLSEDPIEESSGYVLLVLTELSIPSIDKQEQLLFTMLDIGAASISIETKYTIHPMLMQHDFPGNVRELENAIESAVLSETTDLLQPQSLPSYLTQEGSQAATSAPMDTTVILPLAEGEQRAIVHALLPNPTPAVRLFFCEFCFVRKLRGNTKRLETQMSCPNFSVYSHAINLSSDCVSPIKCSISDFFL